MTADIVAVRVIAGSAAIASPWTNDRDRFSSAPHAMVNGDRNIRMHREVSSSHGLEGRPTSYLVNRFGDRRAQGRF
jgi:hypothetical protein